MTFAGFTCTCKYFYVVNPALVVLWNLGTSSTMEPITKDFPSVNLTFFSFIPTHFKITYICCICIWTPCLKIHRSSFFICFLTLMFWGGVNFFLFENQVCYCTIEYYLMFGLHDLRYVEVFIGPSYLIYLYFQILFWLRLQEEIL